MFSDPVIGDDFFGRREVLDLLVKRASALKSGYRQNVAVIGHQQLGKTSLLRQFLHTYSDPGTLTIYVEIRRHALDSFIEQFSRALLYQFLKSRGKAADALEPLAALIDKAAAEVPLTTRRVQDIEALLKHRKPEEAYARVFELTSVLRQETGLNCIVVLDEFHRLGEFGVRNAFSDFGKRIMVQKETMYLLSSSSFTASRKILAEKLALLFGHFERIYLEPFDFDTAFDFLDKKLSPLATDEGLKNYVVALTDGHPFFLDAIADRLKESALAHGETTVSVASLAEALRKLLFESQGSLHQYFLKLISPWTAPNAHGCQLLVLERLAGGVNKLPELAESLHRPQAEIARQLQELLSYELITKNGVFYRFTNKLFKFWLREVHQAKELSLLDTAEQAGRFTARIRAHYAEHADWTAMAASARIRDLLGRFNEELIEFGEKKKRLPRFREFISCPGEATPGGGSRALIAKADGRCWVCRITEGRADEKEVLALTRGAEQAQNPTATKVLIALGGFDENARLLAKEKRVMTLGLAKVNLLLDVYGKAPIVSRAVS